MKISTGIKKLLNKLPYIRGLYKQLEWYKKSNYYLPGHFYSPIISINELMENEKVIWKDHFPDVITGIDLQADKQLALLEDFSAFYGDIPFKDQPQDSIRYYYNNKFYSYTDAIILFSMIRYFRPCHIIEVGSGFSSAVMMDTNQVFLNDMVNLTFIEPYPDRLNSLMTPSDYEKVCLIKKKVQNVSLDEFRRLNSGDIFFVDSSHVIKTGGDLNYILFEILPVLQPGVIIHFHDIFYPFEYPKSWVYSGYNWNEIYALRAFLMFNLSFEIIFFSDYLHKCHGSSFERMPLCFKNSGGSLWIRKLT